MKKTTLAVLTLLLFSRTVLAGFNDYTVKLYERYKLKEEECMEKAVGNVISDSDVVLMKKHKRNDVKAFAIKKGIEYKIKCTSKELVQVLHAAWVAHLVSSYDEEIHDFDFILNEIVDPRYLDAVVHLGGVSEKTLHGLEGIEYFKAPFDINSRPWG